MIDDAWVENLHGVIERLARHGYRFDVAKWRIKREADGRWHIYEPGFVVASIADFSTHAKTIAALPLLLNGRITTKKKSRRK